MREAILHVSKYVGQERAGKRQVCRGQEGQVCFVCLFVYCLLPSQFEKQQQHLGWKRGTLKSDKLNFLYQLCQLLVKLILERYLILLASVSASQNRDTTKYLSYIILFNPETLICVFNQLPSKASKCLICETHFCSML